MVVPQFLLVIEYANVSFAIGIIAYAFYTVRENIFALFANVESINCFCLDKVWIQIIRSLIFDFCNTNYISID